MSPRASPKTILALLLLIVANEVHANRLPSLPVLSATSSWFFNSTPMAPANTSTEPPLTRANIFAIFLTLQLCQLTQPYGSLLFPNAVGWLWRVSPIASFTEGCIIFVYLAFGRDNWQSLKEFRVTAAALLLLRSIRVDDDDRVPAESVEMTLLSGVGQGHAENGGHEETR